MDDIQDVHIKTDQGWLPKVPSTETFQCSVETNPAWVKSDLK